MSSRTPSLTLPIRPTFADIQDAARQIVDAIDRALKRMDAGTYGVCVPAGRRLSVERLEAIPYAEECVDCKARAERRR